MGWMLPKMIYKIECTLLGTYARRVDGNRRELVQLLNYPGMEAAKIYYEAWYWNIEKGKEDSTVDMLSINYYFLNCTKPSST